MSATTAPRCCECGMPLKLVEPFVGGVAQHHQCPSCRVHLHVRRFPTGWHVCTAAERAGQRTAPLPAVASPGLRAQLFSACRSVGLLLRSRQGVEPGMASVEAPSHE